jgi:hypothetical protein
MDHVDECARVDGFGESRDILQALVGDRISKTCGNRVSFETLGCRMFVERAERTVPDYERERIVVIVIITEGSL